MADKKINELALVPTVDITGLESIPIVHSGDTKQTTLASVRDYISTAINAGNPVTGFSLNGNALTVTLQDNSTFDVDVTALRTNTQLSDADIAALGYIKTDTQLTDSDITALGYVKTDTQLSDADITALGYVKTDNNTQLSDADIAALGYAKTSDLRLISASEIETLSHFEYNAAEDQLKADRAIETTLNSIFLGDQHKMSSGSENIFFTNLTSNINFFPVWGGLKDQSVVANQGSDGYIAPSGRVYTNMFSLPLGGTPNPSTAVGYAGDNYFGINIAGLGITTTAAEDVDQSLIRLEYKISINSRQVYKQVLPDNMLRAANTIVAGDLIEWFFDHPVDVRAGTTIYAEIQKVRKSDDVNLGVFQVRQGNTVDPNTGLLRYQATVHNRLFEDKDLEFASPYLNNTAMDFGLDSTGSTILLKDLSLGSDNVIASHAVNTLEAVASGTEIKIKVKDGAKVIVNALPVNATSINGSFVNSVLNQAVVQLNAVFTNTSGFASADKFVDSFSLVGNDLVLGLNDGTSFTTDVTTLGVDENKFVSSATLNGNIITLTMNDSTSILVDASSLAIDNDTTITSGSVTGTTLNLTTNTGSIIAIDASALGGSGGTNVASGAVVGNNLVLTMADATTVTINASNMVNGASLSATNDEWFISYGTNANQSVGTSINHSTVNQQLPFYFGEALTRGSEFKWNFNSNGGANLILGIWDGVEAATAYNGGTLIQSNWNTAFTYAAGFTAGTNVGLTTTTNGTKYVVSDGDALSLRFHLDGHLELMDISSGAEIEIAKTSIPLAVNSFNIQMHTWQNGALPNGIISSSDFIWDIVHDYANTEAGVLNGVLTHTVLKRNLALSPGQQYMIPLNKQAAGETFGIGYSGLATGNVTAEDNLLTSFKYEVNESILADINWNYNTSSSRYFLAGGGIPSWRQGGAATQQGLFSLRYLTDNTLQIWSETYNDLVASSAVHPDGSDIYLHYGVNGNTTYVGLPTITKQFIGQGSQPLPSFQPTAANQTVSIAEVGALNFQIITSDNVVNQFAESDAPSWITLNQTSGILSGTAPSFTGTSADTIVVNCKAGNAIGGTVNFTVTITITEVTSSNSLLFPASNTAAFLTANASNVTALQRAGNGTGASDAWTISMWVKPSTDTSSQALFYYGGNDLTNKGTIQINQFNGGNVLFRFGDGTNFIAYFGLGNFTTGSWNHILVTYSGADTIIANGGVAAFTFKVNGANGISQLQAGGGGYSGAIVDDTFKIGSHNSANYLKGATVHQVAIWDSDQSANLATIYNSGAAQDLSLLTPAPAHIIQPASSVTTIPDSIGNADFTAFGFTGSSLVTDAP